MTKKYKIAGRVIEISSLYKRVHDYSKDYETDEPADFSVVISEEDIIHEKEMTDSEFIYEVKPIQQFSNQALEISAVYRKIGEIMPRYDTVIFHGSAVAVDGQAYLFTAASGTGKSTHTRLWREYFGDRAVMVNDDKPMLKITGTGATVYGTPYNGKHHLGSNISVPLKALCILTRSDKNSIVRIDKSDAYAMLLQQVYRPKDLLQMANTLDLVDRLAENIKLYRLACNTDAEAAEVAYNGMKG